ncbi:MAG: response regulator [Methylococcaceae bacterium]|nr:response regulator [Methylococcaceae bacterium]
MGSYIPYPNPTSARIVIVEDEPQLAELESDYLRHAGFQTHMLADGLQVLPWLAGNHADLILLDLMLPGLDGLALCQAIRRSSAVPIIMVSARVEEADRLLGLELGADDYLCKPFSPREMVARVKTVLRRLGPAAAEPTTVAGFSLDADAMKVSAGPLEIQLTAVEFQLLQVMYRQPGRIFSRSHLMDSIYQDQRIVSDRTIDSHIKKLRKKLTELSPGQELIQSVYGAGYRFEAAIKP